jgi:sigma-B regulation protein RsbQ
MDALVRNNVQFHGRGKQHMVFAHGFGCDQQMWRFVAPAFEDTHRVVLFDHIGCGKSDSSAYDSQRHSTIEGYAQDVLDILRAADLTDVIFVGHSVSSMIGVLASIAEPHRFSRLVMVGPSPRYLNDPPDYVGGFERADIDSLVDLMENNMLGWADFLAPVVMGKDNSPERTQELQASFCASDPYIARRFALATFMGDNRADLPRVSVPSLVIQCAEDAIAPMVVGQYVQAHTPRSTLAVLDASGHCPHMTHPEETIALIRNYLNTSAAP